MRLRVSRLLALVFAAGIQLPVAVGAQQGQAADAMRRTMVCVLRDGAIANVEVSIDPQTGDTLLDGRPFAEAHPVEFPPYAAASPWYINHQPLPYHGRTLMKYGLPRVLEPEEVRPAGEFRAMPLFAEAGDKGIPAVVYVFVRPGCVFHPYQIDYTVGAVRGR
ncbi:MAG TPA: hypothetical protein VGX50_18730 [Longimicrobium sp.]|jgi:hypothetical protein|nr:hypothetical protein [Longimicrobium sp.]